MIYQLMVNKSNGKYFVNELSYEAEDRKRTCYKHEMLYEEFGTYSTIDSLRSGILKAADVDERRRQGQQGFYPEREYGVTPEHEEARRVHRERVEADDAWKHAQTRRKLTAALCGLKRIVPFGSGDY